MPIPDYQGWFLPLLKAIADGETHSLREITAKLADQAKLTKNEREELLPSGQQPIYMNRIQWAKTYLKKAGLVEQPKRGQIRLTREGKATLDKNLPSIDSAYLSQYRSYQEFVKPSQNSPAIIESKTIQTPEESLESAFISLRSELADELLERLKSCSPKFFERMVVQLLVAMGYGGSLAEAGKVIGRSGDDGIDGEIFEDKLGLDRVVIQAKRWQATIGAEVVRNFAGSMEGYRSQKGVIITTSDFSNPAKEFIKHIGRKIVLIGGKELAQYMIDYDIGVSTSKTYVIKKLDSDYFEEEET